MCTCTCKPTCLVCWVDRAAGAGGKGEKSSQGIQKRWTLCHCSTSVLEWHIREKKGEQWMTPTGRTRVQRENAMSYPHSTCFVLCNRPPRRHGNIDMGIDQYKTCRYRDMNHSTPSMPTPVTQTLPIKVDRPKHRDQRHTCFPKLSRGYTFWPCNCLQYPHIPFRPAQMLSFPCQYSRMPYHGQRRPRRISK